MGEGTRLDDLRRWKKGHYVDKQPTGVYLKNASEFNVKVMNGPSNNEGYVYYFEKPLGWLEHYYLNPIPLNQLALNPALEQNPVKIYFVFKHFNACLLFSVCIFTDRENERSILDGRRYAP